MVKEELPRNPLAAYVPRLDYHNLRRVLREREVVGKFTVIRFYFEWRHDLPASHAPEFEPIAVAYENGVPKYVFWRPHRRRKWRRIGRKPAWSSPMRGGKTVIVFVSLVGHAFRVSRRAIILSILHETVFFGTALLLALLLALQLEWYYAAALTVFGSYLWLGLGWRLTYKRVEDRLYVDGDAPEDADVYEEVSFREFVRGVLTRPENNKNNRRRRTSWDSRLMSALALTVMMPRTVLRLLLAGRSCGRGDLKGAYKHVIKAYLALPRRFKTTYFGCWLLDSIAGLKQIIVDKKPMTGDDLRYMRDKFYITAFADAPSIILAAISPRLIDEDRPDEEDLRNHLAKIKGEKPADNHHNA